MQYIEHTAPPIQENPLSTHYRAEYTFAKPDLNTVHCTYIVSLPCVVFPHFIADWTVPTITGDIPPPLAHFSFTKISTDQAVMFGGYGPGGRLAVLRVAYVERDSVVSL